MGEQVMGRKEYLQQIVPSLVRRTRDSSGKSDLQSRL